MIVKPGPKPLPAEHLHLCQIKLSLTSEQRERLAFVENETELTAQDVLRYGLDAALEYVLGKFGYQSPVKL
jgi:hypothetical protein